MTRTTAPLAFITVLTLASSAHAMSGDAHALALAREMIETMGGRAVWSRAQWIYAREDAWFAARSAPADAQFWRRIDAPEERGKIDARDWSREWNWTAEGGYRVRDGQRTAMTAEDVHQVVGWWQGEIYIMYVRLAREDERLRLQKTGERSFRVLDKQDGRNLGEFFLDQSGALYRWRYGFGDGEVDYIYGPLKSFGGIRAPTWGATTDGLFRFFYTDFRLREQGGDPVLLPSRALSTPQGTAK